METKESIRREIRRKRNELTQQQVKNWSSVICQKLMERRELTQKEWIFVYSATQNEVNLKEFIQYAMQYDINIAFPKVHGDFMEFYEVKECTQLVEGAFHILEPIESCRRVILNSDMTCSMLVPGVAFSEEGYRIGYGKGYYDRYLAQYPQIHTLGVAYEMQLCKAFETNKFDIAMDEIITEEREIIING